MSDPAKPRRFRTSLEQWARDIRYAARSLRRAPGFTLTVLGTLVICIGPNAAILSVLYALALKPLPFPDARRLVIVSNRAEKRGGQVFPSTVPQYRDFKAHGDLFAGFALIKPENATINEDTAPVRVGDDWVTADFFTTLGVKPLLGRFFMPEEEQPGRNNVVVLAQSFWESHFNADPNIIGKTIRIYGATVPIIGVAPREMEALSQPTCLYTPYAPTPFKLNPQARYIGDATLYARLKPGVAVGSALAQLVTIEHHFATDVADASTQALISNGGFTPGISPLRAGGQTRDFAPLWLLQGGALLVLLIGCVNVTNLCLARVNARRTEWAIRIALGAGRGALLRQTLAETLILTGAAVAAGTGLAVLALRVFNRYLPLLVRAAPPVTLDWTVLGIIVAAAFAIAVFIAFVPQQFFGHNALRVGEWRAASSSRGARMMSNGLVVAQVAVAALLLVGAGLLIRSFANVMAVNPGFDAAHIVQGRIALNAAYADPAASRDIQRRILAAFAEIPGVAHDAEISNYALDSGFSTTPFRLAGEPLTEGASQPLAYVYPVSPDYFATMGLHVLSGRTFTDDDNSNANPVVIVDDLLAKRYYQGRPVVGHELIPGDSNAPAPGHNWPRIVGVVNHPRLTGLDRNDNLPYIFIPIIGWRMWGFNVLVSSPRPATDVLRDMRTKLHAIDPSLPLYLTGSLQDGLDDMLMVRRGITLLLGAFSALALVLAAIGLYGVLAYDVSQRTREIGIRGAIGATARQIVGLVLRQGLGKTALGLGIGVTAALFLTRSVARLLFGVTLLDPTSYVLVVVVLAVVALLACWIPALRAARVDPVIALRAE